MMRGVPSKPLKLVFTIIFACHEVKAVFNFNFPALFHLKVHVFTIILAWHGSEAVFNLDVFLLPFVIVFRFIPLAVFIYEEDFCRKLDSGVCLKYLR